MTRPKRKTWAEYSAKWRKNHPEYEQKRLIKQAKKKNKREKQIGYIKTWRTKNSKYDAEYYANNREAILKQKIEYYQRKKLELIEKTIEKVIDVRDGFEKPEQRKMSGLSKIDYERADNKKLRRNGLRRITKGTNIITT